DPLVAVSLARNPRVVGGPVTGPLEGGVEQVGFRPADGGEEVGVALAFVAVDGDAVDDAADGDGVGGVTVVAEAARAESAAMVARGFAAVAEGVREPVEGDGVSHERALFCELDQVVRGRGGRPARVGARPAVMRPSAGPWRGRRRGR